MNVLRVAMDFVSILFSRLAETSQGQTFFVAVAPHKYNYLANHKIFDNFRYSLILIVIYEGNILYATPP